MQNYRNINKVNHDFTMKKEKDLNAEERIRKMSFPIPIHV